VYGDRPTPTDLLFACVLSWVEIVKRPTCILLRTHLLHVLQLGLCGSVRVRPKKDRLQCSTSQTS